MNQKKAKSESIRRKSMKNTWQAFVVFLGFMLSPLSWWNDLFINIPLAYVFAIPFSLINKGLFLLAFITGYLLTNVVGLLLLHYGVNKLFSRKKRKQLIINILFALVYTALIITLFLFGVIKPPQAYFKN